MALATIAFAELKRRVGDACQLEDPFLATFRTHARRLREGVKAIRPYSGNMVSFVSSDSGDQRLYFNPAVIDLVRIVDSGGNQCALDALSGNSRAADLNRRVDKSCALLIDPLEKLCRELHLEVLGLSSLLNGAEGVPLKVYRDILEWAVLHDLLKYRSWDDDTIIVRQGMLRTKSFKPSVFTKVDKLLKAACRQHKKKNRIVSIAGIAAQSAVPSLFSVALDLEETLHKPYPCYVRVPADVAESCYRHNRTWELDPESPDPGYRSLGQLHLVKFGTRPFDPVWPVDIAEWQSADAERIIGGLAQDAQPGFPIPDFPMCIQKAYDFARISGFELDILQDIFLDGLSRGFTPGEKEKVLRMKYLAQHLTHIKQKNA